MILTEVEGKKLLKAQGIVTPDGQVVSSADADSISQKIKNFPVFAKAQVLHGNRQLQGLVKQATSESELSTILKDFFNSQDENGNPIENVLLETAVEIKQELYISLRYSTRTRQPELAFSTEGGAGMDERSHSLTTLPISPTQKLTTFKPLPELLPIVQMLIDTFFENDATLLEINPLVKTKTDWVCLDAKIELEDTAHFRHPEWAEYPERSALGRPPTAIEQKAHQVSNMDHRGVAGESFFEFPGGDIGVMASGGGASTLAMDALMAEGLKPANYTEYSGNPTREKVKALAEVVLSLPNLKGLYVVGSNANFTDIYETLAGVVDGLLESDYRDNFAVLIRRGGPRWQEAFDMVKDRLKDKNYKLKLFGPDFPLVKTAQEMKKLLAE